MKKLFYSLCLLVVGSVAANAQIITTSPAILQQDSKDIVITYHADQGNKGLMGLPSTTKVYAHTGVILSTSKDDSDWQYAPTWGDNSEKYEMKWVSANTYTLNIGSIDSYYGLKSGDVVKKLAFVFRTADKTKEGKGDGNSDIMVNVYADGFSVELLVNPEEQVFVNPTDLTFTVNTTAAADINLYLNSTDNMIAAIKDSKQLTYNYKLSVDGTYNFIAQATAVDGSGFAETSYKVTKVSASPQASYPGGTPKMGPIENGDGSVTFCICAPGKSSVVLVGGWNDYEVSTDQLLNYQDYNGYRYFWTTVKGLNTGKDYPYYFIIDGNYQVGDPYARLILDQYNDKYIPSSVFPNLPDYPINYVTGVPLAVYNSNFGKYNWEVKNFKGVDRSQLVIYELLIRDFTGTEGAANGDGTIAGVMGKLDYLKGLGINAIELMPIMEFNGNLSWGYNPNFYFAPDKAYGTPDDYRKLIDACHKRGMAVILDIVFNQSDGWHPWYQMYPSVYDSPFYNGDGGNCPHAYSVLNDWNQDNPVVQQQFKDILQYWLKEFKVDGFRFDLVKGLGSNSSYGASYNASTHTWSGNTDANTNKYNASRVARMKELYAAMKEVNPNSYCINENLAGAQEENEMAADNELNWANINYNSCQFAMGWTSDCNLNRFYAPLDSRTWGSTVSYAESHDEERMAYKINQYGNTGVKGNTEMSCRRLGSVAAQMLLTPGAHMIWQFQEFGADETTKKSDGSNNTDNKKVVWSYLNDPDHAGLAQSYRELCFLRKDNPELFVNGVTTTVSCAVTSTMRYITLVTPDKSKALLMLVNPKTSGNLNYDLTGDILDIYKTKGLQLMSASYGTEPTINANTFKVAVPAGGYVVFGTPNLVSTPEINLDPTNAVKVYADGRRIVITGDYKNVCAYNTNGVEVSVTNEVAPGLYIVVVDGNATKVLVR